MLALTLLMLIIAYLMGSINSAILICRIMKLPDPRSMGSGNPGATNVLRSGGKLAAGLTLWFDIIKGTIPVYGSYFLGIEPLALGMISVSVCLGHMYPVFFDFKGGKGVATAFGSMLPIGLDLGGLLLATWLSTVYLSGFSSVGAIVSVSLAPVYTWFIKPLYTVPVMMLSILIIFRHRENVYRLLSGNEPKINQRRKSEPEAENKA